MTTLEPGEYIIPDDYTIDRKTPHMFVVREKKKVATRIERRCKDCAHFTLGKAFLSPWREDYVCELRRKKTGLYYIAGAYNRACEKYEER